MFTLTSRSSGKLIPKLSASVNASLERLDEEIYLESEIAIYATRRAELCSHIGQQVVINWSPSCLLTDPNWPPCGLLTSNRPIGT